MFTRARHAHKALSKLLISRAGASMSAASSLSTSAAISASQQAAPAPPRVQDFISALSARREPSPTRALIPLLRIPGMLSLGTGLPNPSCVRLSLGKDVWIRDNLAVTLESFALALDRLERNSLLLVRLAYLCAAIPLNNKNTPTCSSPSPMCRSP